MMKYDPITVGQLRSALADLNPDDLVYTSVTTEMGETIRLAYLRSVDQAVDEVEMSFGHTTHDRELQVEDTTMHLELQEARDALEAAGFLAPVTELKTRPRSTGKHSS
jgi:hypothetical protein